MRQELELGLIFLQLLRCAIFEGTVDAGGQRKHQVKKRDVIATLLISQAKTSIDAHYFRIKWTVILFLPFALLLYNF